MRAELCYIILLLDLLLDLFFMTKVAAAKKIPHERQEFTVFHHNFNMEIRKNNSSCVLIH